MLVQLLLLLTAQMLVWMLLLTAQMLVWMQLLSAQTLVQLQLLNDRKTVQQQQCWTEWQRVVLKMASAQTQEQADFQS